MSIYRGYGVRKNVIKLAIKGMAINSNSLMIKALNNGLMYKLRENNRKERVVYDYFKVDKKPIKKIHYLEFTEFGNVKGHYLFENGVQKPCKDRNCPFLYNLALRWFKAQIEKGKLKVMKATKWKFDESINKNIKIETLENYVSLVKMMSPNGFGYSTLFLNQGKFMGLSTKQLFDYVESLPTIRQDRKEKGFDKLSKRNLFMRDYKQDPKQFEGMSKRDIAKKYNVFEKTPFCWFKKIKQN